MMPVYRFRKLSGIGLKVRDAWTDLVGAVNSAIHEKGKIDADTRKQMKNIRKKYRKGEIIICDGDPELLFSGVIKGQVRMITADCKDTK